MAVNLSHGVDDLLPNIKRRSADLIRHAASSSISEMMLHSLALDSRKSEFEMATVVSLYANLMSSLVDSSKTVSQVDSEKVRSEGCMTDIVYVPVRPVDYLLEFLIHYCPLGWLRDKMEGIKQEQCIEIREVRETVEKHTTVNHYHLAPWSVMGNNERTVQFMSWEGDYYDGSPQEWDDLKKIRDFIASYQMFDGRELDEIKWKQVQRMVHEASINKFRY